MRPYTVGPTIEQLQSELEMFSNELHDGLLQFIVAARMMVDMHVDQLKASGEPIPEGLEQGSRYLEQAVCVGRDLMNRTAPVVFEQQSFHDAVAAMLESYRFVPIARGHSPLRIRIVADAQFNVDGESEFVRRQLFRIIQGAVSNVVRHSDAADAYVQLKSLDGASEIIIADDGVGDEQLDEAETAGITAMRERARLIGADLAIRSDKSGTQIRLVYDGRNNSG